MNDVIEIHGQFYIRANASIADAGTRVLKHADTFAVFDRHGDIRPLGFESQGVFHDGTRYLGRWKLGMLGASPLLLSSNVREENDFLAVDLTNPAFATPEGHHVASGTLHISRTAFLQDAEFFERIDLANFGLDSVTLGLELEFDADFADVFEVRGTHRAQRGRMLPPSIGDDEVTLSYEGRDAVVRRTCIHFNTAPQEISGDHARFLIRLNPQEKASIECRSAFASGAAELPADDFDGAFAKIKAAYAEYRRHIVSLTTSNQLFNDWIDHGRADLHLLATPTRDGPYPYAGIPWYSCVFGRDGIVTALETLWIAPEFARAVLCYLAERQATELDPIKDAEPGKILHEERKGEMAALNEVPFGRYYGSIDSTPLWLVLAGCYYDRTADRELAARLWPNIERAIDWIDRYGDCDGDGFVEYSRKASAGLSNQGWKDSGDSVYHADGSLAKPPIALCEVQGYVFEAKSRAAKIADALGKREAAERLRDAAHRLQRRFHDAFWCEEIGMYAIALDGDKRPCAVRSSNAGQCLYTGIAERRAAERIRDSLLGRTFFSGWGVRTIATSEPRYNPMSYHDGSIWPHDNALIAAGLSRYGFKCEVIRILEALFEASQFMEGNRLPELYCGFARRGGEGPVLYPVACNPQAWSSGAIFLLIQSALGMRIDAAARCLYFENPRLPHCLRDMEIADLPIGNATVDLAVIRHGEEVAVNVRRRTGELEIVVVH